MTRVGLHSVFDDERITGYQTLSQFTRTCVEDLYHSGAVYTHKNKAKNSQWKARKILNMDI